MPDEVRAHGTFLVNDIWGATTMEWDKSVWESTLDGGFARCAWVSKHTSLQANSRCRC